MKLCIPPRMWLGQGVASFAEAWIEIEITFHRDLNTTVASFAEAWIEIISSPSDNVYATSPPSRRRGLKFFHLLN